MKRTDPKQMELTAKVAFAKVYPVIARHIVDKYGIATGHCLDAGSGPGSLSIALARITDLSIVSLDMEPAMTLLATANFTEAGLPDRIEAITADVHKIPFPDGYFDLIVSRGSVFFWDDVPGGLAELYRVLKPGGVCFCGGGMGNEEAKHEANTIIMTDDRFADMREFWQKRSCKKHDENREMFTRALAEAGLNGAILQECGGLWIELKKYG